MLKEDLLCTEEWERDHYHKQTKKSQKWTEVWHKENNCSHLLAGFVWNRTTEWCTRQPRQTLSWSLWHGRGTSREGTQSLEMATEEGSTQEKVRQSLTLQIGCTVAVKKWTFLLCHLKEVTSSHILSQRNIFPAAGTSDHKPTTKTDGSVPSPPTTVIHTSTTVAFVWRTMNFSAKLHQ